MINLLITSPDGYAQRIVRAFEERHDLGFLHPVSRPLIETRIDIDSREFKDFIHHLEQYDYVAFSSRKAIEAFILGLEQEKVSLPETLRLCAIGKDNELIKEGLHVEPAFVSQEPSPMGIVCHLKGLSDSKGKSIVVLAPAVVGMEEPDIVPNFILGLEQIGMCVSRVTAYRTQAVDESVCREVSRWIESKTFEGVVFTSGTEIEVFRNLIPAGCSFEEYAQGLTVICFGPYTASCAQRCGIKVDFTASSFGSFQELVDQIRNYYINRK